METMEKALTTLIFSAVLGSAVYFAGSYIAHEILIHLAPLTNILKVV